LVFQLKRCMQEDLWV